MTRLRDWAQATILGLTGLYFAYNVISGNISYYIAAKFILLTWFAAALLITLAVGRVIALLRHPADDHDHEHSGHDHDHPGGVRAWIGLGIVALPVLFGVLVPSQPLTSQAVDGEVAADLGTIKAAPGDWLGIDPLERNVLDWLRAFSIEPDPAVFDGQTADVIGFVYRDARFDRATQFMAARFIVSCCVADAQAIGLVIETSQAGSLHEDDWVHVRGTFQVREFDGTLQPVLIADTIEPAAQPDHPYLYP
jgi:putative membrane protein